MFETLCAPAAARRAAAAPAQERVFETLLRAGFAQRRKLFLNSAAASGRAIDRDALAAALREIGLTEKARAEEIPLEGFLRLAALLATQPAHGDRA